MATKIETLTPKQQRIIDILADAAPIEQPVFVSELVSKLELAGESSITPTLKLLDGKGWITIYSGLGYKAPRIVRLTQAAKRVLRIGGLPVLGAIPAGMLAEAMQDSEEFIEIGNLLDIKQDDFLLRVKGDSMIGDNIIEGDLVWMRPNIEPKKGDIVAAYAGDEYSSTLKRIFFDKSHVRLKASNPAYSDILVPYQQWRGVAGVFRGLVRNAGN